MKKLFHLLLVATALSCFSTGVSAREPIRKGDVVIVPLQGEISSPLFLFLRRAEKAAESAGASAIVFEMNTFGGRLDTAEEITTLLNHASVPTYTFINSNAGSAGALIALATQHIYMSPVSAIGAAAPIQSTGEDLPTTAREKTVSYWSALIRASAARNGHNPEIGEAFMDKEKEVKIGDKLVHAKGSLLTLNAQEATALSDSGKPLLAEGVADSVADVMRMAVLNAHAVRFEPTGFERLAFWITRLAPLLLLGGIIGAYLEFKIPGMTLPGLVSAICFALFFFGHHVAGLAGWEVVAMFLIGICFLLVEIVFFAHSTIIFGVVGVFLIFGSLVWAMVDRYPGETFVPTGQMLRLPMLNLLLALLAAVAVIAVIARFLPRTTLYRRFVLSADIPSGPSISSHAREFSGAAHLAIGAQGTAVTTLRPSGKAQFANELVDVVTQGEFIAADRPVSVVSTDGMRIVVKSLDQSAGSRRSL